MADDYASGTHSRVASTNSYGASPTSLATGRSRTPKIRSHDGSGDKRCVVSHRLLAERAFACCERKVGLHGHDLRGNRREDGDDKDSERAEEDPISRTGSPLNFLDLVRDEDRYDRERDSEEQKTKRLEFPRFGGHLLTERRLGREGCLSCRRSRRIHGSFVWKLFGLLRSSDRSRSRARCVSWGCRSRRCGTGAVQLDVDEGKAEGLTLERAGGAASASS